tara:strand:- start:4231 stop:4635 length:405 start_codon:yes stop_codon:yes gene_type:complete
MRSLESLLMGKKASRRSETGKPQRFTTFRLREHIRDAYKLHRADVDCTNRIDEYLDAALEALIRKHGIPDKPFRSPKKGIVAWISEGTERKIRRVCVYLNLDEDQAVEAAVENLLKRNGYHTDLDLASVGEETR